MLVFFHSQNRQRYGTRKTLVPVGDKSRNLNCPLVSTTTSLKNGVVATFFQKNSSHVSQIFQPGTVFFSIQEAQQRAEHSNATILITENDSTNGWNRGGGWSFFETIVADNKTIPVDAIFLKTETR
jgi:hypothetical protein